MIQPEAIVQIHAGGRRKKIARILVVPPDVPCVGGSRVLYREGPRENTVSYRLQALSIDAMAWAWARHRGCRYLVEYFTDRGELWAVGEQVIRETGMPVNLGEALQIRIPLSSLEAVATGRRLNVAWKCRQTILATSYPPTYDATYWQEDAPYEPAPTLDDHRPPDLPRPGDQFTLF